MKATHHIQARCRTTGHTLIIKDKLTATQADNWRPSDQERVKYKYFRKNSVQRLKN